MAEYYAAWLLLSEAVSRSVSAVKSLLYYLSYPVFQTLRAAALVLSPFIAFARFLLLPLTNVVHAIITLVWLPFRLRLLQRLEVNHRFQQINPKPESP
jgi:hypothetical protein